MQQTSSDPRIASMFSGDCLWASGLLLVLWLLYAFVFYEVLPNAGQNNVDRWVARGSGIGYSETRAYVEKVERLKRVYHDVWGLQLSE